MQVTHLKARHLPQLLRAERVELQGGQRCGRGAAVSLAARPECETVRPQADSQAPGTQASHLHGSTAHTPPACPPACRPQPTCTISSTRLRNSGRKWWRTTSITAALASGPLPRSSRMLAPCTAECGQLHNGACERSSLARATGHVHAPAHRTVRDHLLQPFTVTTCCGYPLQPLGGIPTLHAVPNIDCINTHQVAGHDDDCVVKSHGAALGVSQPAGMHKHIHTHVNTVEVS